MSKLMHLAPGDLVIVNEGDDEQIGKIQSVSDQSVIVRIASGALLAILREKLRTKGVMVWRTDVP